MDLAVNESMPILKGNKLSTGILDLDIILEGGYYNPGSIMVIGPSGMEKNATAYHFAGAVKPDEMAFIICGNSSPPDIINKAATIGINLSKPNIGFIDCYSATLGNTDLKPGPGVKLIQGPGALNDISLALNEAAKESAGKKMRVIFDTLSTFVLYNPQDSIRKFLNVIEGRLKSLGATTMYLVDEGVHDKQLVSLLQQGMDEVFSIEDKGGQIMISIPEIGMEVPIRVGPTGIIIV